MKEIACFITSHGLGHAMRATAVLEELVTQRPDIHPHIFTSIPKQLFTPPLESFTYHYLVTDIGMVQANAFHTDLTATVERLDALLPYDNDVLDKLAKICENCAFLLCDISPMGIAVGRKAGIPSILVENFTWDWIYETYIPENSGLQPHIDYLGDLFAMADYHIQTDPLCKAGAPDLHCGPIARKVKTPPEILRNKLGCNGRKTILISMGGIPHEMDLPKGIAELTDYYFIMAGQKKTEKIFNNVLLLKRETEIYHPDLINAVDLVLCKSGYSTISECYQTRTPLAAISRAVFPESKAMESFIKEEMGATVLREEDMKSWQWLERLETLIKQKPHFAGNKRGAEKVCSLLTTLL